MKKAALLALGVVAAVTMATSKPCSAAFVIGGENGWQLSTDGIVDVFATYNSTTKGPGPNHSLSLLSVGGNESTADQRFGVGIGLLPSVVAFNVKAPTTNGVDSTVRVGIYPAIQNKGGNRFDTSPNIDFREFFYTAKGAYGELLAGRALNLFQGKNILNDMTLLTAGVVPGPAFRGNTTLGHIGYGYLYTNFGPQLRYTTPDLAGTKIAVSVGEPYKISGDTGKTNSPRVEAEISYAKTYGSTSVQAWVSGLYQTAPRRDSDDGTRVVARKGQDNQSIGGAYGVSAGFSGVNLMLSGYGGKGLGMVSAQDGDFLGSTSTDAAGEERTHWGYLAQATCKVSPSVMLGVNYGQSRQEQSDFDKTDTTISQIKNQEAAVATVTYNLNKFTQFIAEYSYAQNTWHDGAKQHSNQFALGTMFYW
ncbi:MAG: hypothetical protein H7Y05_07190 [Steroidobacteraceae bacterium]|nr:hypothetical protein [Deltaproteobacteria bacterium]